MSETHLFCVTWPNTNLLPFGPLGTNFSEIRIKMKKSLFKTICRKMSCAKLCPLFQTLTLKRKCHFDQNFIIACNVSCQIDSFQCSRWWKFHHNDNISVSVNVFRVNTIRTHGWGPSSYGLAMLSRRSTQANAPNGRWPNTTSTPRHKYHKLAWHGI